MPLDFSVSGWHSYGAVVFCFVLFFANCVSHCERVPVYGGCVLLCSFAVLTVLTVFLKSERYS